ncbi:MAG: UDP-N-acetylmuramate dehydrogenase [Candidatus Aminicenantia bacterium]
MEDFIKEIGRPVKKQVLLKNLCHFKIGGPADFFFIAKSLFELKESISLARKYKIPYFVIGQGTNLLFDDQGFRGLIIKNMIEGIEIDEKRKILKAFSGTPLSQVVEKAAKSSLSGLEVLAGIPGTLGGAICGNAGAYGKAIGDFIIEATIIDSKGKEKKVKKNYFQFKYRASSLKKSRETVLAAKLKLTSWSKSLIEQRIKEILAQREKKHPPFNVPSGGSFFKNIVLSGGKIISAGFLLDQVGAKKIKIGQAAVYEKHSNFLINKGGATCEDVLKLASILKKKVKETFGFELEEEVIYVKEDFSKT